jgi:LPXTG-site transpeptidase (sortase) family protein
LWWPSFAPVEARQDAAPHVRAVAQRPGCQDSSAATCTYPSGDRLVIPSLQNGDAGRCGSATVNAPVNVYDVDDDLQMGIPVADCDVVRENFGAFAGVGGYPGDGGTTVLAGHVDFHPNYQAVFWYLRNIQVGAELRYERADGQVVTYAVDWAQAISDPDYDWGSLVAAGEQESIVLITCDGTFNPATHEYDRRFVTHGYRTN